MSEKDYKPVKTSKVGGSPFTGVLGWIDNRLPLPRILYLNMCVMVTMT